MKIISKNVVLLVILSSFFGLRAQNEFSKWYFGTNAGLDFSTIPPTVLTNGTLNTAEGVASICDNAGNFLFCTDGIGIINSAQTIMANGNNLFGNSSSTQAALIVKQPGNANLYYVFTTEQVGATNGANYSIVDMSLAAGLGSVTVKNVPLHTPTCEKQVAVRHCNGKDVWIITHDYGSNQFRTFLLNSTGVVMPPVISAIGEAPGGNGVSAAGQIKISPDGKKLAVATITNSAPNSLGNGGFFLFDFDASSGVISNSLTLLSALSLSASASGPYGAEFSPDGKKVYCVTAPGLSGTYTTALYQWDICGANSAAIIASQYSLTLNNLLVGSMQRAIDGKIYITALSQQSLSVINNPNASGAAMNFVLNGQSIAPKTSRLGLPNYINTYTRVSPSPFTNTVTCQTVSFTVPPVPTFSSGCSASPYPPSNYLWDFGEPAAGASNTSTLTNPIHTYSNTGTYSVSLILYSNCTNDTLRNVVAITTPGPTLSVAGTFTICKGAKQTYTASGGSSYLWSNNTTSSTAMFSPTTTTIYSVTATLNSCSSSKVFTVTVNPCLGIVSNEKNNIVRIFPNPVKDLLIIEAQESSTVGFFDMNGKLILESKINPGYNEINTTELKPGVYTIQAKDEKDVWYGRLIKME